MVLLLAHALLQPQLLFPGHLLSRVGPTLATQTRGLHAAALPNLLLLLSAPPCSYVTVNVLEDDLLRSGERPAAGGCTVSHLLWRRSHGAALAVQGVVSIPAMPA